jgi:hypothetical protein
VLSVLSGKEHAARLADRVLVTSLEGTASLLRYFEKRDPSLHKTVLDVLSDKEHVARLAERVFMTPLEKTGFFLAYVEKRDSALHKKILDFLRAPEHSNRFLARLLGTRIGHIAPFLHYLDQCAEFGESEVAEAAKGVERLVRGILTSDMHRKYWIDRLVESPAEQICAFLKILRDKGAKKLAGSISGELWNDKVPKHGLSQPEAIFSLLILLKKLGRPDLANATAIAAISTSDRSRWHRENVYLPHASIVLNFGCGADANANAIREFADDVFTADWLAKQYSNPATSAGTIAAAIYGVFNGQGPAIAKRLDHPALRRRLVMAMTNPVPGKLGEPSQAIQLGGCCALIDVHVEKDAARPTREKLRELCIAMGTQNGNLFWHMQIQFWLGLRVLSPAGPGDLVLPNGVLDAALSGFEAIKEQTQHTQQLRDTMLAWLKS